MAELIDANLEQSLTLDELKDALRKAGCEQIVKPTAKKKALSPAGKKPNLLIDIEAKIQQDKGAGYEKWAKTFKLKEAAKTLIYLQEHGLNDYEILSAKTEEAGQRFDMLSDKIKASEKRLSEITSLQKSIGTYRKTRDIYVQYRQSGYSKKFLVAHESDIALHRAAKQEFDRLGLKKLPSMML